MWKTRWAVPEDLPVLLDLFERAFGHPMPQQEWEWKYRLATSPGVVCLYEETIIAFNGGMPRGAVVKGAPCSIVQMGDVMVDPAYRGVLTRRGPFFQVVQAFFGEKVGEHHAHRYAFGFPHARSAKLGSMLKLYCTTDRIVEAQWPSIHKRRWRSTAKPLQPSHAPIVDQLWEKMVKGLEEYAVGTRDWQWLKHRYFEAPARGYLCWLIVERLTNRALGVCVLRQHNSDTVELLDIVAPPEAMTEVVHCAQHIASRLGAKNLMAWLTPTVAACLAATKPQLTQTDVVIPGSQVNGLSLGMEVSERWWLMGGDTDFR